MYKSRINVILITILLFACATQSFAQTVAPAGSEGKLIAVLKSKDASYKDKADACRQLAIIAGKDSVPVLAGLLADEKLSHMARYAIETIPGASVDRAFRDALGKLKGPQLVGLIGSIGVRGRSRGVSGKLINMLDDPDPDVAQAAARALGKISRRRNHSIIARGLTDALETAPAANRLAICEGLFRCAESIAAYGHADKAVEIYDRLMKLDSPHQVRAGALRGALLTRSNEDAMVLLRKQLRNKDYTMFSAAVQAAQEMSGSDVTKALCDGLKKLSADNQILIIQTLGAREDAKALPALDALAKSASKPVRLAAIRALPDVGGSSGDVLLGLLDDTDADIAKAARESLGALKSAQADSAVMKLFKSTDNDKQLIALELMGRRRMTKSIPDLLKAIPKADPKVRQAAIRKVGELGGPDQLGALTKLLLQLTDAQDLAAAERAVSDVCGKADNPQSCAANLATLFDRASSGQKATLLRVLSTIGGPQALKAVRAGVDDPNKEVHVAAIRALGSWKTADAAPDLLALAKNADNPNDRTLALRSYLAMASRRDLPARQRLEMCRHAATLAKATAEKKKLLGTLGGINSPVAVELILPHLDNAATKAEAATAILGIAENILKARNVKKQQAAKLIGPLEKVVAAGGNAALARRAKALLQQAKNKAG